MNILTMEPNKPYISFSTYTKAQEDAVRLFENFTTDRDRYELSKLVSNLEEHFHRFPLLRGFLLGAYDQCYAAGYFKLANEIARIYVECTDMIAEIGVNDFGLPLIFRDIRMTDSLANLVHQTAYTNLAQKLGHLNSKPVISCLDKFNSAEALAFLPYMSESFEILTEFESNKFAQGIADLSPYSSFFYRFSQTQYGHFENFFFDCYPELAKNKIGVSPFTLQDGTIEKAMNFLKNFGLNRDDEFVLLYLNEDKKMETPNVDVTQYLTSVNYLIDQGFKVIRLGNNKMSSMLERIGFIDLTKIERPMEVDIFVSAAAKFYFGSCAGPYSLSSTFGVPCCLTSQMPCRPSRPNDFVQTLQFRDIRTKQLIPIKHWEPVGLSGEAQYTHFMRAGYEPSLPTNTQNLRLIKEMLEYLSGGAILSLNQAAKEQKKNYKMWGGVCNETLLYINNNN